MTYQLPGGPNGQSMRDVRPAIPQAAEPHASSVGADAVLRAAVRGPMAECAGAIKEKRGRR